MSQMWYWTKLNPLCTYPFGLDPVWGIGKDNFLTFTNGVKMKLAVIFGVVHMSMGIFLKGTNMVHQGKYLELFTEVIGGFFILFLLFGWMDVMIIMKWFGTPDITDCNPDMAQKVIDMGCAPGTCYGQCLNQQQQGIINVMVTTVFQFGAYATTTPMMTPFFGATLEEQYKVNMAFVYIAILLMLVMLCTKPCIVKFSGGSHVHEEIEFQAVRQDEPRDISGSEKKKLASINNTDSRDVSADDVMMRR